jgi:type II secretory pathway pseudopilin PulG
MKMLKPRSPNQIHKLMRRQKGMALLILLSLVLIAVTAVAVSHLSLNSQSLNRSKNTTLALSNAKNIVMGYALMQPVPGTLPCPDTDGDGDEDRNPTTQVCLNRRGFLPYKTLGIEKQVDGSGQLLWYATDLNYAGAISVPHNSSRTASLTIDAGQPMAFIVIASNTPLANQNPALQPLANVSQFLEGDNADNTLNSYTNLRDSTHNDVLLGVTTLDFWMLIEKRVLDEVNNLFDQYRTACSSYPWAADFSIVGANSINNRYEGALPLGNALPVNWNTGCAVGIIPGWLSTHWRGQLYYSICNQPMVNPPTSNCLSFSGSTQTAAVIVIAPGSPLAGQNRNNFSNLSNFFENEDASPNNRIFDFSTPGANDNDSLRIISP